MRKKIILMFGPPCSGKSTVGQQLADRLGFAHIITSDLLDRYREDARETMAAGVLAADSIMIPLLDQFVPRSGGVIIDSLRSPDQVFWLKKTFSDAWILTFHFEVSGDQIKKRLEAASKTKRGARADDGVMDRRLCEYQKYSRKTVPCLLGLTLYERVDANDTVPVVLGKVLEICDSWGIGKTPMLSEAEVEA